VDYIEDTTIAADDTSLTDLQARGKLVMGLDDSFPPMGYRDENNEIVGFDIDLATEVCERLGVTLELQPIEWASKEAELSSGRIDCIWNGMTINDERIENMFIPKAYVANKQVIIVAADSDIKGPADLAGKKVALQNGSSALEALEKNAVYDEVEEVIQLADNQLVYLELKSGRVDAVVMDEPVGRYIITNDSGN
jgi:polar amino acid transport system substrate-binding protein